MISMGLMTLLGLGFMQLQSNQYPTQKSLALSEEVEDFVKRIRYKIYRDSICKGTFEDLSLQGGGEYFEIEEILQDDVVFYQIGNTYAQGSLKLVKMELRNFFFESGLTRETLDIDNSAPDKLVMQDIPEDRYKFGQGELAITLEKIGKIYGAKTIERKISLSFLTHTNGALRECGRIGAVEPRPPSEFSSEQFSIVIPVTLQQDEDQGEGNASNSNNSSSSIQTHSPDESIQAPPVSINDSSSRVPTSFGL
jgi:hypothetical protein